MAVFNFLSLHMLIHTHTHTHTHRMRTHSPPQRMSPSTLDQLTCSYRASRTRSVSAQAHMYIRTHVCGKTQQQQTCSLLYIHTHTVCYAYIILLTYVTCVSHSMYVCLHMLTLYSHTYVCIMYPSTHIHTLCVTLELSEYLCISVMC